MSYMFYRGFLVNNSEEKAMYDASHEHAESKLAIVVVILSIAFALGYHFLIK